MPIPSRLCLPVVLFACLVLACGQQRNDVDGDGDALSASGETTTGLLPDLTPPPDQSTPLPETITPQCDNPCPQEGITQCDLAGGALLTCLRAADGCLVWQTAICYAQEKCVAGACRSCEGTSGTYRNQVFLHNGENRYYFLQVPPTYSCSTPMPLLVDLHGTAGEPSPEEAYGLEWARQLSSQEGFILLRPRSRFSEEGGQKVYRWDQNSGDPQLNREFIAALVEDLAQRYHVDAGRRYVMGFSSGTNQVAMFLESTQSPFTGYGFVGGGSWHLGAVGTTQGRLYLTTGFRDYMHLNYSVLIGLLDGAGFPAAQRLIRQTDAGHELYAWMYGEMWAFFDRGERPEDHALTAGWTSETTPVTVGLTAAQLTSSGEVFVVGDQGTVLRRDAQGSWSSITVSGASPHAQRPLSSVCVGDDGRGLAIGAGLVLATTDGGATWSYQPSVPEFDSPGFGYAYINGMACRQGVFNAGGYFTGAQYGLDNQWVDLEFDYSSFGITLEGQVASVRVAPWGTWLATGYYHFVARSENGADFAVVPMPGSADWYNDAAPVTTNVWVVVAEDGRILRSGDDGKTFALIREQPLEDLYAVKFRDDKVGLAVGRSCAAWLTKDGGSSWTSVNCGRDRYLGGLAWLPDGSALVVGEAGLALRFTVP